MASRTLAQSRILITGASRGVGRELALTCAQRGAHLLLAARDVRLLQELQSQLLESGAASAVFLAGDISDEGYRDELLNQIDTKWQSLDILVNNAGVSAHGRFSEHDAETLRQIMEVNFFAATELTRDVLLLLRKGNQPLIVNIGSVLGLRGIPFNSEYCASKFALRGWSEALRPELVKDGIDVLMVSPGTIDTEFFEHLLAKSGDLPWGPQKGIAAFQVAQQTVRAIERGRSEIFPNWRGKILVTASRWMPKLVDRVMRRYG